MLVQAEQILTKEEQEDNNLRTSLGGSYILPQSTGLNQPYKSNINMYRTKLQMAATQD